MLLILDLLDGCHFFKELDYLVSFCLMIRMPGISGELIADGKMKTVHFLVYQQLSMQFLNDGNLLSILSLNFLIVKIVGCEWEAFFGFQ